MTTEDALREEVAIASCQAEECRCDDDGFAPLCLHRADEVFKFVPLPVLAWCSANPEAAKGLASGERVAVPRRPEAKDLRWAGILERDWLVFLAQVGIDPSTPAPSGEAQGETT